MGTVSATSDDLWKIWTWNATVPETVNACIHEKISKLAIQQPNSLAVCSWDGDWTYGKLEKWSTRLAQELIALGVKPGSITPICFEKSRWTLVAVLAVMKCGSASVIMDTSLPEERLRYIASQVDSVVILCSTSKHELASRLSTKSTVVIAINDLVLYNLQLKQDLPTHKAVQLPIVDPSSRLYVVFTSGTTGIPKGVVISHSNYASAIHYQQDAHGFEPASRVYDFASYAFDVSWSNIIHTLTIGACLCIPSDDERKDDLVGSIERFKVTHLDITPSIAAILPDSTLQSIETLVLGGEKLPAKYAQRWSKIVKLLKNPYGPSECTPTSTLATLKPDEDFEGSIGKGFGLVTWIVDPDDVDTLAAVGSIGELLLEGPLVGQGYLGDSEKTSAAFIEDPTFLLRGGSSWKQPGRRGRLYRTGDLVRYGSDGDLSFCGRKDTQVKLNGQRVELGDVEYHVRQHIQDTMVRRIVAEVIVPETSSIPLLVAFLEIDAVEADSTTWEQLVAMVRSIAFGVNDKLASEIPSYMIPVIYIPLQFLPLSPTGKTDRNQLRQLGASMDLSALANLNSAPIKGRLPVKSEEKRLQRLWSYVLGIDECNIGPNDNFLRIANDVDAVIRLIGAAEKHGLSLTAANVTDHPRLEDMAMMATAVNECREHDLPSFALVHAGEDLDWVRQEVAKLCTVGIAQIENVYPCTPLQEGLLSLSARRDGDYTVQYRLKLQPKVNMEHLGRAWQSVVTTTPILRTRFVSLDGQGLMQVVIDEIWQPQEASRKKWRDIKNVLVDKSAMVLGSPLAKFELVNDSANQNDFYFVWTMHHALYDAWSIRLMLEKLEITYRGETPQQSLAFQNFIKHVQDSDDAASKFFWTKQFVGSEAHVFPMLPSRNHHPESDRFYEKHIGELVWPRNGTTASSFIRAALAVLLSKYTDNPDVVFGVVVSGRQASIAGVEEIIAPTIATVPLRVVIDWRKSLLRFLQDVQSQAVEMIAFEQTGLHLIKRFSAEAGKACQFQTLLVVHPAEEIDQASSGVFSHFVDDMNRGDSEGLAGLGTYAFTLECHLDRQGVYIHAIYDQAVLEESQVRRLVQQFEHVLRQMCASAEKAHMQATNSEMMQQPSAGPETRMREIWARILHLDQVAIGLGHSFFQLGGDSLAAMKLVGEARKIGIKLSVRDIFRNPSLRGMVSRSTSSLPSLIATDSYVVPRDLPDDNVSIYSVQDQRRHESGDHDTGVASCFEICVTDQQEPTEIIRRPRADDREQQIMRWEKASDADIDTNIHGLKPEALHRNISTGTAGKDAVGFPFSADHRSHPRDSIAGRPFQPQAIPESSATAAQMQQSTLSVINAVTQEDLREIWAWNATVYESSDVCVHHLVSETARRQPRAPAINAWDGDFSYAEVEDLSNRLAYQLVKLGVFGTNLPLCFEKSRWTPIAMLAVMKAGAACVTMDISQPEDRLRDIVSQLSPVVILCSSVNQGLASRLAETLCVVVDESSLSTLPVFKGSLPTVSPLSPLYIVFTSGSTGIPKGVVISHSNFSTAIKYQQAAHGFECTDRVYDFASYAFDVSWSNLLHTFSVGACLCIPSTADSRDDLAGSLSRFDATFVDLTPSTANILPAEAFMNLRTVVLGGEKLFSDDAQRWASMVNLKNPYGPSECTPTATLTTIVPGDDFKNSIGRGLGVNTWIVDTTAGTSLVPVGAIGELMLEGPLVGKGYLGDAENTAAVFLENPQFLRNGGPEQCGRNGRVYKTGDLVSYNSDGSLNFIERKDRQVKIHGQRVELSEIEYHIRRHSGTCHAACLIPQTGVFSERLVGLFSITGLASDKTDNCEIQLASSNEAHSLDRHIESMQLMLRDSLPAYMVPSIWIALRDLPLSVSGKLNHKALLAWLVTMDSETYAKVSLSNRRNDMLCQPTSEIEHAICKALCHVLALPASSIDLGRSFIANGGDSISAMRFCAHCRAAGITFSVAHLLTSKSLVEFGASSSIICARSSISYEEESGSPFELSPIQQWFFEQEMHKTCDEGYCNQGFYLRVKHVLPVGELKCAIECIVKQHSMLRARFAKVNGNWTQKILDFDCKNVYQSEHSQLHSMHDLELLAMKRHRSLDIENGPLFSADICTMATGEQYLVLIAHHLVVDLVSWRIILDDIEMLLSTSGKLQPSLPFQVWNKLQITRGQTVTQPKINSVVSMDVDTVNALDFWQTTIEVPNTVEDHVTRSVRINERVTSMMLTNANAAFNTEPVELILCAVWDAFFRIFAHRDGLTLFIEGHGREPWSEDIDLSRTVGWFTTLSPLYLSRKASYLTAELVRRVKDSRRRLPENGYASFTSRYLNDTGREESTKQKSLMEVTLNFHGQFQQLQRKDALFDNLILDKVSEQGLALPVGSLFTVEVSIEDKETIFTVSANRHIAHQDLIVEWIEQIVPSMENICEQLVVFKGHPRTLCDHEFLHLNYQDLDRLENEIIPAVEVLNRSAIEKIYPCSPIVDGILISQIKNVQAYKTLQLYEIRSCDNQPVSLEALARAWQRVIAHQPALRTVFVAESSDTAAFSQIVLQHHDGNVIMLRSQQYSELEARQLLSQLSPVDYQKQTPPHRIAMCQISDHRILCQVEMSHAITDGASTDIIGHNLVDAYTSTLKSQDLLSTTEEFTRALSCMGKLKKVSYWKHKLSGVESCRFPRISDTSAQDLSQATSTLKIQHRLFYNIQRFCNAHLITVASLFQTAWALILSAYTGSDAVCFGYLASGRDLPILGLDESIGAYTNMLISSVKIIRQSSKLELIQRVHDQSMQDLDHQHCSLASIQHEVDNTGGQPLFNTIMSYQKQNDKVFEGAQGLSIKTLDGKDPTEYDIVVNIGHSDKHIEIVLDYSQACLSNAQAKRLLSLMQETADALVAEPSIDDDTVTSLELVSQEDRKMAWTWNSLVPETVEACVHDIIAETTRIQPQAIAICAWDGQLTYGQLDKMSTRLAMYLVTLGVGPETIVPLCFEKSKWVPISMLAVMKAGGASVVMDPAQPEDYLRSVVAQVDSIVMLCSSAKEPLAKCLATTSTIVVRVDEPSLSSFSKPENAKVLPLVTPKNKLYVVFTSGTTGTPKGVVITHSNVSSAIRYQRQALAFTPDSRIFDFSSYSFDVVWCNLVQGLSAGSCICIPSDHDRKTDFMAAITNLRANVAIFTPSTIRGLKIDALNTLQNLHFIGEPLHEDIFKDVDPQVVVSNLYGPTECTTFSTVQILGDRKSQDIKIGLGTGLNTWVVDIATGTSLVPIGSLGELLLEGPLVAAGYLCDDTKTADAFIKDPPFLLRGAADQEGRNGRLYKTGDIVRYNADGSLTFVGRKDTQVKIKGQRFELGDVESRIQSRLMEGYKDIQIVAEIVSVKENPTEFLVAFVCFGKAITHDLSTSDLLEFTKNATEFLGGQLATQIPSYMIPLAYIPIESIPMTTSGKTDRRSLRHSAQVLTWDQLTATSPARREPSTAMEHLLQSLWSVVLGIARNKIGADDSFLRIGGDSIGAIRLAAASHEHGYSLSVVDVLKTPKLSDLAQHMYALTGSSKEEVVKFSLLCSDLNIDTAINEAAIGCGVKAAQIQDMYPCTPLQEGLLALTAKRPGDYIIRCLLVLHDSTDTDRFREAWEKVVKTTPILRTRIVDITGQGLTQAILEPQSHWITDDEDLSLSQHVHLDEERVTGLGTPLVRFGLIKEARETVFMLALHHAVYDGWSLNLLLERLEDAYRGKILDTACDFRQFVEHILKINWENAKEFWIDQLRPSEAQIFPIIPPSILESKSDGSMTYQMADLKWPETDITPSTAIRASLSILMAVYCDASKVIFGATTTGRQAAVPGIELTVGPVIATVPCHVMVPRDISVQQFLSKVQAQSIDITAFEQTGLQRIRLVSAEAKRLCDFQTLLIVQPLEESAEWKSEIIAHDMNETNDWGEIVQGSDTYALTLECHLGDSGVRIKISYDSNVMEESQVMRFVRQLERILHQICSPEYNEVKISDIEASSNEDVHDIWTWNATVPETVNRCVHELIDDTIHRQPQSQAVCAWDGDWTYNEVDILSTKLAHHLVHLGVDTRHIVPLLFEKSKWMPIAMLGVMKSGASSVAIDTSQPEERLLSIIRQVNPIVVLSSLAKKELANKLTAVTTLLVNITSLETLSQSKRAQSLPRISPSSRLYLVFTSGTTGTPKGVIISHSNFSSAITHQKAVQGIRSESRVYDFASYAFDIAWSNVLLSFEAGACLCIPSDTDRKDDLNGSIARLTPCHADLTPSAALVLSEDSLRQIKTLTLGGERLAADHAERWSQFVTLRNAYGPCECTPSATFTDVIHPQTPLGANIGRAYGLDTWVADLSTGQSLAPIGSVGELLLEGPLVGAGYLNDLIEKAFVEDPAFLVRGGSPGQPGRRGRLYRTNDMVRYNPDGSLAFVGRKDTQVKINGQRVELSEIEDHMARYSAIGQCAAMLPYSGPCANRLVGIVNLKGVKCPSSKTSNMEIRLLSGQSSTAIDNHIRTLRNLLFDSLPQYMSPSIWIVIERFPMTASGKRDVKAVQAWLAAMDSDTYAKITDTDSAATLREPRTEIERVLYKACSHILNVPAQHIYLDESFVANGGDSISAMRLASYCRTINVTLSVAGILQKKSLAAIATTSSTAGSLEISYEEDFDQAFSLSPIQQWFFEQVPFKSGIVEEQFYNQGFYVKCGRRLPLNIIQSAISKIVHQHSMLRSRFQKRGGRWEQLVLKPGNGLYHFDCSRHVSLDDIRCLAQQRHHSLNIERGPVFSVDVCVMAGEQYLILIAHHLVVDLVSWRIILDDLEILFNGGALLSGVPFQVWNKFQTEKISSLQMNPDDALFTKNIHNDYGFWNFEPTITPNSSGDHQVQRIVIDQRTTSLLLSKANKALRTEPLDLLLSAVWDAFFRVFPQRDKLTIFNEGHGRGCADIDVSRTVGWFTTMSADSISRQEITDILKMVSHVKDARRLVSSDGRTDFASRYLHHEGKKIFQSYGSDMEVVFNYHGQFQQLEASNSLFEDIDLGVREQGKSIPAANLIGIEVSIEDGCTQFEFSFNRHISHQELIREWIVQINSSLQAICNNLSSANITRTLCDFEFLKLDYQGLEEILGQVIPRIESFNGTTVADICPCSPTVDGILLSQIRQPSSYKTSQLYEISSHDMDVIDLQALSDAWQQVVAHQPALRMVFISGLDRSAAFNQAVLTHHHGDVCLMYGESEAEAMYKLKQLPDVEYGKLKPPHRISFCAVPNNKVLCRVEMSHAITDGTSTGLLVQDLVNAYDGALSSTNLMNTTRGFTKALITTSHAEKTEFWRNKLLGVEPCQFPHLSDQLYETGTPSAEMSITLENDIFSQIKLYCSTQSITPASLMKSAWALTLSAYVGTGSICFGYLASGRDIPILGLEESIGAYTNMLVCRADIQSHVSGREFVQHIHNQITQDLEFQHCSLANIQHELDLPFGGQLFNSIVSYQRLDDSDIAQGFRRLTMEVIDGEDPTEYEIMLSMTQSSKSIMIDFDYSLSCLNEKQASRVLSQLESTVLALVSEHSINSISKEDLHDIWAWNKIVPETVEQCVHDLIRATVSRQPEAPAVCAWDGNWTYFEFDELSSHLAHYLIKVGVKPNTIVPVCFEKSRWTPIAILAIMKAGAASLTLDACQPEERLRSIVDQIAPAVMICSSTKRELANRLTTANLILLDHTTMSALIVPNNQVLPKVSSASTLYVTFTSGSTGLPKGVMITHSNFSSAIKHQQDAHGFKATSRVFDFASYAFDVSWSNFIHTFTIGACLCIPSDADRNDLAGSMARLQVTHADMTPSAASLLPLETFKQLETVVLGGESLTAKCALRWSSLTSLMNPYGPCECTPTATIAEISPDQPLTSSISIGRGIGLNTWIVDPNNPNSLLPVGAVGELYLEGPLVGAGYLEDPLMTAEKFIKNPQFLLAGDGLDCPGRRGRVYKTGDLVRYNEDGSLVFVGRKDDQVKINGQRVELGDIETHVTACLAAYEDIKVVAEFIVPKGSPNAMLVAFVCFEQAAKQVVDEAEFLAFARNATAHVGERLAAQLPSYMVPSAYFPLRDIPMTTTGKVDRQRLREVGKSLTLKCLGNTDAHQQEYRQPNTQMEQQLQFLWSLVLGIDIEQISASSVFLRIGGDSIGAMRLVTAAREKSFALSIADVFKSPTLSDMASLLRPLDSQQITKHKPFSLLPTYHDSVEVFAQLAELDVFPDMVEDVLPVTDHQARCIALTYTESRNTLLYHTLDGAGAPEVSKIRATFSEMAYRFDALRTVFIAHRNNFLQVVLKSPRLNITSFTTENIGLEQYTEMLRLRDLNSELHLGRPLTSVFIIHQTRDHTYRIILRVSHAQHDGISMMKMWTAFKQLQNTEMFKNDNLGLVHMEQKSKASFSYYMHALSGLDKQAARIYWRGLLQHSAMTHLKPHMSYVLNYGEGQCIIKNIARSLSEGSEFTFSTVLKAAWAYVLAQHTASDDVVFSTLTHGRGLLGVQDVFGACVNIISTRISFRDGWTARDLIAAINTQQIHSMQHENLGTREIVQTCTDWPSWTHSGSVIYHHNFDNGEDDTHDRGLHNEETVDMSRGNTDIVDVHITSAPCGDNFAIEFSFAPGAVSDREAQKLATKALETITLFYKVMDMPLSSPHELRSLPTKLHDEISICSQPSDEELMLIENCPAAVRDTLSSAWSEIFALELTLEKLSSETFFDLGGDLVSASLLSAHIKRRGYHLTVEEVLENPAWHSQLALLSKQVASGTVTDVVEG